MKKTDHIPAVCRGGIGNEVARVPGNATAQLTAILLGAGLALVTATPSLAQSYDPSIGTGNIVPFYGQAPALDTAQNAYARIVPRAGNARFKWILSTHQRSPTAWRHALAASARSAVKRCTTG